MVEILLVFSNLPECSIRRASTRTRVGGAEPLISSLHGPGSDLPVGDTAYGATYFREDRMTKRVKGGQLGVTWCLRYRARQFPSVNTLMNPSA